MRLEIKMAAKELKFAIPINYNYLISLSLNRIFCNSSRNFSKWLIDDIYRHRNDGASKLFTFSKLINNSAKIDSNTLSGFGETRLIFSAPIEDDIAPMFIESLKSTKSLQIESALSNIEFYFKSITQLPEPEFGDEQKFVMLSPTTMSKMNYAKGLKIIHFFRIDENEAEGAIAYNLRKKYELLTGSKFQGNIEVKFDKKYIETKGGSDGVSKLITIREGTESEFKIKGFIAPLTIKSSPEILKIAYQCGIGERNSLGMGMLETVNSAKRELVIKNNMDRQMLIKENLKQLDCSPEKFKKQELIA